VTAPQLRIEHKLAESAVEDQSLAAKKPKDAFNLLDKSESERTSSGDNSRLGRAATTNLGILAGKEADTKHFWALEGVSTLKIDLEPDSGSVTTFHSLGDRPELVASVIDERRITPGAVGLAGLVLLIGVALTFQAGRKQVTYVAVVLLAATVPPLLTAKIDHLGLCIGYLLPAGDFGTNHCAAGQSQLFVLRFSAIRSSGRCGGDRSRILRCSVIQLRPVGARARRYKAREHPGRRDHRSLRPRAGRRPSGCGKTPRSLFQIR
jgi:hypothetical protein